jgi:hypothetical protein
MHAWLFFLSKFIESIPTHQYPLLCALHHPPSSDRSFSRSTCAIVTGADPFSSSSLFSGVSNACWEEHDGSSWELSLDYLVHLCWLKYGRTKNDIALEAIWSCFPFICVLNTNIQSPTNSKPYFVLYQTPTFP